MMSKRVGVTWERSLRLHASQLFFHLSWALLRKLEGEITEMTLLYIISTLTRLYTKGFHSNTVVHMLRRISLNRV
jgi:hypothetical protein